MRKKLSLKRIGELTTIFKEIHIENSKIFKDINRRSYFRLEVANHSNYNEAWNKVFMTEIRPILLDLSHEENLIDRTFLFDKWVDNYGVRKVGNNLNLEEYLTTVVEKSNSYFDYLLILFEKRYRYFKLDDLDLFSNKHIFNGYIALEVIVEIKEIKIKRPYINTKEKKIFSEIDYYWRIKDYEKLYFQSYTVLIKLMKWYLGESMKNKKVDIPESLKWILSDHQILKLEPILIEIIKKFDGIIKDFGTMRSMLGKQEGENEKNKEWIMGFENSLQINQKVCGRITIDLLKTIHNAILVSKDTKKINFDKK